MYASACRSMMASIVTSHQACDETALWLTSRSEGPRAARVGDLQSKQFSINMIGNVHKVITCWLEMEGRSPFHRNLGQNRRMGRSRAMKHDLNRKHRPRLIERLLVLEYELMCVSDRASRCVYLSFSSMLGAQRPCTLNARGCTTARAERLVPDEVCREEKQ